MFGTEVYSNPTKNVENEDKNPFAAFSMGFVAPDVTATCQEVWRICAEVNLHPWVKRARHYADFHKINAACTVFL
jgi:hypothetical protein